MAWRACTHRHRRQNPLGHLFNILITIGMMAIFIVDTEELDGGLILTFIFLIPFGLFHIVRIMQWFVDICLARRAWKRASRSDVKQVLVGLALPQMQVAAGYPVRTVVVPVAGRAQFVRFAFARESLRLTPGPVDVDLFDVDKVRVPARLRPLNGPVVWAFARRNGDFALEGKPWGPEDGWRTSWWDGWPDSSKHTDPDFDGDSGDGGE